MTKLRQIALVAKDMELVKNQFIVCLVYLMHTLTIKLFNLDYKILSCPLEIHF